MKTVMIYHKSTKNTHAYVYLADKAPITQLYIQKHALPTTPPKTITVEVKINELP